MVKELWYERWTFLELLRKLSEKLFRLWDMALKVKTVIIPLLTPLFTKFGTMMITTIFWNFNQFATSTFSTILHTAIHITRNLTAKSFKLSTWDPKMKSLMMKALGGLIMQSRYENILPCSCYFSSELELTYLCHSG